MRIFCFYIEEISNYVSKKVAKMLATRLKARIGENKTLVLHLPNIPPGDVEVIILKEEERFVSVDEILSLVPKRRVGKILSTLRREDIYTDAR